MLDRRATGRCRCFAPGRLLAHPGARSRLAERAGRAARGRRRASWPATARSMARPGRTRSSADACTAKSIRRTGATGSSRTSTWRRATRAAASSTSRPSRWPGPSIRRAAPATLIYSVVNRGNGDVEAVARGPHLGRERLAGRRRADRRATRPSPFRSRGTPTARRSPGRCCSASSTCRLGTTTMPLRAAGSGYPHAGGPISARPSLTMSTAETVAGVKTGTTVVAAADWAFADCRTVPFPGTPDPTRVCACSGGFDPTRLYELVYTAKDPLVLGIGLAATRDLVSFLRHETTRRGGHAEPGGRPRRATWSSIGNSQSGNFIKTFIHLGFNEDLGRADGLGRRVPADRRAPDADELPLRAAGRRRRPLRARQRAACCGGAATTDRTRGADRRPACSIAARRRTPARRSSRRSAPPSSGACGCRRTSIGTDAKRDIPLPANVRRYYYPGTTHGGGRGGFQRRARPRGAGSARCPRTPIRWTSSSAR